MNTQAQEVGRMARKRKAAGKPPPPGRIAAADRARLDAALAELDEWVPASEFPKLAPHLVDRWSWQWMLRNRDRNGLGEAAIRRRGGPDGRLIVNVPGVVEYLKAQRSPVREKPNRRRRG